MKPAEIAAALVVGAVTASLFLAVFALALR